MKHKELPVCVERLSEEKESHASLGVTHLDDFQLVTQSSPLVLMLVLAGHININNPRIVPAFNDVLF